MAPVPLTAYAGITDHVDAETPLLDAEALRPSYEHEQRRLLREIEEGNEDD